MLVGPFKAISKEYYALNITTCSTGSSGTPWGGLQQSNTEPPSAPIKGEKAAPGTDLPPQKGERLPGSNCTLSAKRQGEAVYPHAREGPTTYINFVFTL